MECLAGSAYANERSSSLLTAFKAFCTLPLQNFEDLDAKASAQKLTVQEDNNSERVRSKSWLVESGDRHYQLHVVRSKGAGGQWAINCGVLASDVRGDDIKADLVKAFQLGSPSFQRQPGHNYQAMSSWKTMFGSEEMQVTLVGDHSLGIQVFIGRIDTRQ
jgi:hypothetical protein